jgi:hypothetical protein
LQMPLHQVLSILMQIINKFYCKKLFIGLNSFFTKCCCLSFFNFYTKKKKTLPMNAQAAELKFVVCKRTSTCYFHGWRGVWSRTKAF